MNFDGGTVRYNIEVDTSGFTRDLDALDKEFNRLSEKYDTLFEKGIISEKDIKKVEEIKQELEDLGAVLEEAEEGSDEYEYALQKANKAMDEFASTLGETKVAAEETVQPMESLGSAIAKLAGNAGLSALKGLATGATTALVGLAKKGVSATNFLETSQTAMSGLLGSMELGQKAMGAAADFWSNNPFNRFDVTTATKQLVQYGRSVGDLSDDLKILGNVSLSTGVSIDELAIRYGRVSSSGRAMTEDIEVMSNRGVPIYRELAKVLNTTQQGVREFASQGKIDFETFKQAMEGAVDPEAMEKYEQTLDRAKDKLSGSVTTLAGALAGYKIVNSEVVIQNEGLYRSWIKLLRAIAGDSSEGTGLRNPKLLEGLQKIGDSIAKVIDKIAENIEPVFNVLGKIVDFIGDNSALIIPIAATALNVISGLASNVPLLGNLFGSFGKNVTGVVDIFKKLLTLKPGILGLIALVTAGLVSLIRTDDEFKKDIQDLFSSLGKILQSVIPIVQTLVQAFLRIAQSGVVTGALKLIVGLVARLADLLASVPTEVLISIVTAILAIKASSISPWLLWVAAIGVVIDILKDLAPQFYEAAHNAIIGLVNGFNEGVRTVVDAGKRLANAITTAFKNALGIHSPSTVMYGLGQNVGIGLADGITDSSSVVQKAMDNLAKDVLSKANQVITNRKDFGLIDYNGMYKDWKKVANLFTIGSEQYETAISKMEEARKQVNLEIINLQNEYNSKLDESIKKIKNFYNLFDDVSTKGGKNASQIIKNLDKQVAQTAEWAEAQKIISGLDLDPKFIEELKEMGVSSVSELSSIANMTASELEQMNDLWLKKQSIATTSATEQLADYKNDVLKQVSELADGIDGETVTLTEEGGRLVSSISDGITGALPTLADSLAQMNAYIADAARKMSSSGAADTGGYETDTGGGDETENLSNLLGLGNIQETAKKWVSEKLPVLAGIVIAGLTLKFLPKVASAIKSFGSGGSILSNLFGAGKSAKAASTALDVGSHIDLSGINNLTSGLSKASKGMSKLDKVYLAIAKGAVLILLIAADIWAISSAIKKMNENLKGIEWADFGSNLGMMAATIATFAVLAGVMGIEPIAAAIAIGGAIMLELAVDIAAIATAIGYMDRAIPNDIDRIKPKIGLMAETILSFEALTALAGVLAAFEGLGILVVVGIAEEIRQVAEALYEVDKYIPSDIERVGKKVQFLADTIRFINHVNLGEVINAIVTSWSVDPIKKVAGMYAEVAFYLGQINNVNIDYAHTESNIAFIKRTISFLQTETDAITGALNSLREKAEADTVEQAGRVLFIYGQIVDSLNKIASLDVKQSDIVNGVTKISKCVETVGTTLNKIRYTSLGGAADNVEKIKDILNNFGTITPVLNELVKEENKLNTGEIKKVIDNMDSVFTHMKDKLMGMGSFTNREKHVAAAKGIIESFDGIAKTAKSLTDADHTFDIGTEKRGLKKQIIDVADVINTLKEKLYVKTGFGTVAKQMGEVQSVLNKFSEMSLEMKKQLTDAYLIDEKTHGKIKANIKNIRNLVWEIEQINTSGFNDLENKVKIVESAKTIAEKFAGFADAMRAINTEGMADTGVLTDAAYRLLDGIKTGVTDKLPDMDNLGGELATHIANGAIASYDQLYAAGAQIQSAVWNGIQDKFADEYQQGIYLAYSLRDGIVSVLGAFQTVGGQVQSNFWQGIQSRFQDDYYQGRALGERFRQGLYDVDYANSGWWAVQGFINGANNRAYSGDGVYHTGWWVADTFLRGLKDRGGQGSPWKTTMQSGIWAAEGLIDGMESMESEVINEAEVLADGIVNALDLSDTTLTPTLSATALSPSSGLEDEYAVGGNIVINQNNTNYTEYDYEQSVRDLSYALSQV